jgi:peptidoglycan L-alanyl-D-glutamate endopeptidase CwlK
MYKFGERSLKRLNTCDPRLQEIANLAIQISPIDFTIIHGWRGQEEQNELVAQGLSKTRWPTSKHNYRDLDEEIGLEYVPSSRAFDFAPWIHGTIPWKDTHAFAVIAGVLFAAANDLQQGRPESEAAKYRLRWGGDWDMDGSTTDQSFMDWGHMELR